MSIMDKPDLTNISNFVNQMKRKNFFLYSILKSTHSELFNMIWKSSVFTPQQVCDQFGTEAAKLFQLSAQIQELLATADATYVRLVPPKSVTINEDGTVLIGV